MKKLLSLAALALAVQSSFAATAAPAISPASPSSKPATAPSDWAVGVIQKMDATTHRVTLQHGEIKSLNMPPMTMVFRARHPDMLRSVKVGDKVRFLVEMEGGVMIVTQWIKAQP